MAKDHDQSNFIYEERTQKMVSLKDGKFTERPARSLKPCSKTINEAVKIPNTPLLSEIFSAQNHLQQWRSKVHFKGCRRPQRRWKEWVEKLSLKYKPIWKQTGIFDAITSSTYEVRSNHELVVGLSEFWCPDTNSFVFPWGEASITLEDVMILGGLPVLGEPVTSPVTGDNLKKIEEELNKKRLQLNRNKDKKASHSGWLKHFMEGEESDELEHVAFLSLWLSRCVFPSLPKETMGTHVFSIAIHLSQATPVALAPAVLASLYQNLRLLNEQALKFVDTIVVSGPLQLVQLWAYEHFPLLGPCLPNSLQPGEPRSARWNKLSTKITLPLFRSVVKLAENFQWRPYAAYVKNWRRLSYYKEVEEYMYHCLNLDEELQCFVQCLCACELTGVDCCKEKYMPHRVAMQFGLDQDLPGGFPDLDFICLNVGFFVPARTFEPGVSARYLDWWNECKLIREDAIKDVILELRERSLKSSVVPPSVQEKNNEEDSDHSAALGSLKKCEYLALVPIKSEGEEQSSSGSTMFNSGIMMDEYFADDEFPLSSKSEVCAANRTTMKSNVSRPLQENNEDDLHTPVALKNLEDSQTLSQVSTKSKCEKNNSRVTLQFPANIKKEKLQDSNDDNHIPECPSNIKKEVVQDSSDDDHMTISEGSKKNRALFANRTSPHKAYPRDQFHKVVSPMSSDSIEENHTGKRKLSATRVGIKEIIRPSDGAGEEVKSKAANSAKGDEVVKKMKKEAGHSMDIPVEIDAIREEILKGKASKRLSVGGEVKEGENKMAGESINNPIDLDDITETTTRSIPKRGLDLEGRIKKLEQILGVTLG